MKKLLLAFIATLSLSAGANCLHTESYTICSGDRAIGRVGYNDFIGNVVGINPFKDEISIQLGGGDIYTFNIENISIGKGCLHGYCVGDRAVGRVGYNDFIGNIVGVNPSKDKVSIQLGGGDIYTFNIKELSIGKGCLHGYCIGDRAIGRVGYNDLTGNIVGVNPFKNQVSIHFDSGYRSTTYTYAIEDVSIESFCLKYPENHPLRKSSMKF